MVAVSAGLVLVGLVLQLYARAWAARLNRPGPAPLAAEGVVPPPHAAPPAAIEEPPDAPLPPAEPEPEPPPPDGDAPGR
jgi:hypothetical protein